MNEWLSDEFLYQLGHYHMAKLKDSSYVYTMHNGNLGNFTRIEKRDKAGNLIWKSRPTQGFFKGLKIGLDEHPKVGCCQKWGYFRLWKYVLAKQGNQF